MRAPPFGSARRIVMVSAVTGIAACQAADRADDPAAPSALAPPPPAPFDGGRRDHDAGRRGHDAESPAPSSTPELHDAAVRSDAVSPSPALALSDGFEHAAPGGPPDPTTWMVVSPNCSGAGRLSVDGTVAHAGAHSLRIDGGGGYCDHVFAGNAAVISGLGPQVYARFFVRFSAALGSSHATFLAMKDGADSGKDVRMGGQNGVLMWNRESDDATLPAMSPAGVAASVVPDVSTWLCIEAHIDESGGTLETRVNSRVVPGLVENGTIVPDVSEQWLRRSGWRPALQDFRLGWESYAGETMVLWIDDVALASSPIGCGN